MDGWVEVEDNVPSANRLLSKSGVTKTVLLDECGTVTEPTSEKRGVKERSGGVGLVIGFFNLLFHGPVNRSRARGGHRGSNARTEGIDC